ncbi:uncharacterized protein LOC134856114 [Symsagittifera roscoffensis]|uniref:uncharacterized protein LOC134856114 n=1 Tax=Symsagittifera roscoffensis TaxID=84072 RepID=UPI00307B7382
MPGKPKVEEPSKTKAVTRVFASTTSSHSWISAKLVKCLNLSRRDLDLTVNGINTTTVVKTKQVQTKVSSNFDGFEYIFELTALVKDELKVGTDTVNIPALQSKYPYLAPIKPIVYSYADVDLIIGQDSFHAIRPEEYFKSEADPNTSPVAVRLPIGWVLSGPMPTSTGFLSTCFKCNTDDTELACQIKRWYEIESYGAYKQVDSPSTEDKRAAKILDTSTVHDGSRNAVGMLWAEESIMLPDNYYSSLVQLKSLEKRLAKDPHLRDQYSKTIEDDLSKGYVIQVPPHNFSNRSIREWYLPHHPVVNPNKPGKVRRVLNGASKFHGTSLNKSLLVGPDLLQNLVFVLLRFRQHHFAVSADIEGMFLQVGVLPEDQPSLRFLWREDPTADVVVHQYTRFIFGARDSPMCANYALQRTAMDNQAMFPDAASAVLEKFYMDDYLDSFEDPDVAFKMSQELITLLALGGFKLTKFITFLRARVKTSLETQVAFVFGKARVAPMKALSIPKLELQAALLATRLKEDVLKALTIPVSNTFMWTDSITVLQWLNSGSKQPTFVANRIGEILESTTVDHWFHVLSGDNPADTGTRGISAESLKTSSWVNGPSLLKSGEWLFKPSIEILTKIRLAAPACDLNEGLQQASNFSNVALKQKQPILFDWEKLSSFRKLQRVVAFMLRLSPKHRHYRTKVKEITDPVELETAKQRLLLISQKESFEAEYLLLSCNKTVKKSSHIAQYAPFMGPAILIRSTEYDTKHPIILDGRHSLVKLFVSDIHYRYQHQFLDYLRAVIHLEFAILNLRSLLKSIEVHCLICRKRKAKTVTPMMTELPVERLGYRQPPFTNCGVDYFGPFYVSIRRSSEKRWCFLFTCMTTRAVHIEIVSSMDTSSCVMGI